EVTRLTKSVDVLRFFQPILSSNLILRMNNSRLFVFFLGALLALSGCTQLKQVGDGKNLLSISRSDAKNFLKQLGYQNNSSAEISRSRTGDKLFIQFDDATNSYNAGVKYRVAIVSSNNIVVKDLPGDSM